MRGPRSLGRSRSARTAALVALGAGAGIAGTAALMAPGTAASRPVDVVGLAAAQGDPTSTPQGLLILGNSCKNSDQSAHTGFQEGPRCVQTSFGEVGQASRNPTLLITGAPRAVTAGRPFTLRISTRNLVRDRFLGAAAGGYYLESSYLNSNGLQRGHFHTACRMLDSLSQAPDPAPAPAFFKATEDGKGGTTPDTVEVSVTDGLPRPGIAQCAVWAGDGSHRTPMMQRANQTPAFDTIRIRVVAARQNNQQNHRNNQQNGQQGSNWGDTSTTTKQPGSQPQPSTNP